MTCFAVHTPLQIDLAINPYQDTSKGNSVAFTAVINIVYIGNLNIAIADINSHI